MDLLVNGCDFLVVLLDVFLDVFLSAAVILGMVTVIDFRLGLVLRSIRRALIIVVEVSSPLELSPV